MKKKFKENINKLRVDLSLLGLILAFLLLNYFLNISWFCPFFDGIGIPCPGCGFTSAIISLFHLDFKMAYYHHPFVYLFPFYLIMYLYHRYYKELNNKQIKILIYSFIFILIMVYILRFNGLIPYSAKLSFNDNSLIENIINVIK
ncbi:MAG: DUF2752 domain-containing protein [Bacilli bacterium]|jgi:hypothetical protein|nr:DUF2752 domain-containing protein [Bacilli bacterium]